MWERTQRMRSVGLLCFGVLRVWHARADEYCCPAHDHDDEDLWTATKSTHPWLLLHHYWRGGSLEARDSEGLTPLFYSARAGEFGMVRMFLDLNASTEVRNNEGITPLFDVVKRGYIEMARLLLEEGANPNVYDARSLSPIWYASQFCWTAMVRLLLDYRAELETLEVQKHYKPLSLAAMANRFDVAKLLLERGADPYILYEQAVDPSYRRDLEWWDVDNLYTILKVRGFIGMIKLILSYVPVDASDNTSNSSNSSNSSSNTSSNSAACWQAATTADYQALSIRPISARYRAVKLDQRFKRCIAVARGCEEPGKTWCESGK